MNRSEPGVCNSLFAHRDKEGFVKLGSLPPGIVRIATLGLYSWQCF